jgi:F0F1-type ATP synthase membrane subunit b/b'
VSDAFYQQVATWSQILGAFAFLAVLVYLWNRFLTPAVLAAQIQKNAELAEAEKRRDAAKAQVAAAELELAKAGEDVGAIGARAVRDAGHLREKILAESKAEGERLLRNAEGELARGRLSARELLREELLTKALQMARESAAGMSETVNSRLVAQVVESLEHGAA